MKKILFIIPTLLAAQLSLFAQYNHGGQQAEILNIKYLSKDETLNFAKEIGGLSTQQTEQMYLLNLQINRKYMCGTRSKQISDKNSKLYIDYSKEKELAYKKVLTPSQYGTYQKSLKKNEVNQVNSNLKIYDNSDFEVTSDKRISSTR